MCVYKAGHGRLFSLLKKYILGTSLAVQQLGLHHQMQGVWVQSLVRELRSHMAPSQKIIHIKLKKKKKKKKTHLRTKTSSLKTRGTWSLLSMSHLLS